MFETTKLKNYDTSFNNKIHVTLLNNKIKWHDHNRI